MSRIPAYAKLSSAEKHPELLVFILSFMIKVPVACGGVVYF
jgi:hypothetical protein